jgi:autotransporter-associated beta strand protein
MSIIRLAKLSVLFTILLLAAESLQATVFTWDATGVSPDWGDGLNWVGGTAPPFTDVSNDDDLVFDASTNTAINLRNGIVDTVNQMTWNAGAPAYSYNQNAAVTDINLRGSGISVINNSSNTQTFNTNQFSFVSSGVLQANGAGFDFNNLGWFASNSAQLTYSGGFDTTIARIDATGTNANNKISTAPSALGGALGSGGTLIIEGAGNITVQKPFRIGNGSANAGPYASIRILHGDAIGTGATLTVGGSGNVDGRFELANNIAFSATKAINLHGRSNDSGTVGYDNSLSSAIWNFSGDNSISSPFTLTDAANGTGNNFNFGSASGTLTVSSALALPASSVLSFQGAGDGEFSGAISGGNGVLKLGTGTLTLSGANVYTGNTEIEGGTLTATSTFLDDMANVLVAGGANFNLAYSGNDTVRSLYLNGIPQQPGLYGVGAGGASFFTGTGLLNVTTLGPPLLSHPGDFDGDGDVDGADFVAWQTNFPIPSGATPAQGDADGDTDVDGADFAIWQNNFPTSPSPGASPVPEPQSLILLSIGGLFALTWRRMKG